MLLVTSTCVVSKCSPSMETGTSDSLGHLACSCVYRFREQYDREQALDDFKTGIV